MMNDELGTTKHAKYAKEDFFRVFCMFRVPLSSPSICKGICAYLRHLRVKMPENGDINWR